ncbi:hypothetical protein LOY67_27400 [Pseudomonas sp. B21-056]|uniref:hypothetical protein n=1 Tax=Pseudomonas sp. B21-056 TaxID=2895495 RepID=UPI002232C41D|nr:hypothetical protein [Pseudomonas sp. B21-056]UZE23671.1 hypothetical protein LOY67_27400 [Pseudomonas sp. B21-056]
MTKMINSSVQLAAIFRTCSVVLGFFLRKKGIFSGQFADSLEEPIFSTESAEIGCCPQI